MSYAGDLTPQQAWDLLAGGEAVLVDVRTRAEWSWVGVPDLSGLGQDLITVEWNNWPDGRVNDAFVDELRAAGVGTDQQVLFLCRSGVRSQHSATAATDAGFSAAYNVAEGFEGSLDDAGHRGVGGWKAAGLPWRQT